MMYYSFILYIFAVSAAANLLSLKSGAFILESVWLAVALPVTISARALLVPASALILFNVFALSMLFSISLAPSTGGWVTFLQFSFIFCLFSVIYSMRLSAAEIGALFTAFIISAAALALIAMFSSDKYFVSGRLAVVGGNANLTGFVFGACLLASFVRAFEQRSALFGICCVPLAIGFGMAGSFGAAGAFALSALIYFLCAGLIKVVLLILFGALLVAFIGVDYFLESMVDSEIRALQRLGFAATLYRSGVLDVESIGSAAARSDLLSASFDAIMSQPHLNLISGFGVDSFPLSSIDQHAHTSFVNLWYSYGLLVATLYSVTFFKVFWAILKTSRSDWTIYCLMMLIYTFSTPVVYSRQALIPLILFATFALRPKPPEVAELRPSGAAVMGLGTSPSSPDRA